MGGGFLYTNRDTLSVGLILNIQSLFGKGVYSHDLMEQFKLHPTIASRLRGGELVEYGAKLISSGWASRPAAFHGDGWMVAGDAAGFVFSNGLTIQGMNYAVATGLEAAETALAAKKAGSSSAAQLAEYDRRLAATSVLSDFREFARLDRVKWNPRIYSLYPKFAAEIFRAMFNERGAKQHARRLLLSAQKAAGVPLSTLVRDGIEVVRDLSAGSVSANALHFGGQGGHDLEEVSHDPVVGDLEDRGRGVGVDRDDHARTHHPDDVLDRARDPDRDVELRRDRPPGLADLKGGRSPPRVRDRTRGSHRCAERGRELLHEVEILGSPHPSAARYHDHRAR